MEKKNSENSGRGLDKIREIANSLALGRPKPLIYEGVYLAVADKKHVIVLVGPPPLLEMLEDESDRLANLGWWGARGLPKEPGVWRCRLEERDGSYDTVDGLVHDEDWRVVGAERVWAPPAASVMDS